MNDETMREAFEKWCDDSGLDRTVGEHNHYFYECKYVRFAWKAWQACTRAQASAPENEADAWITPQHLAQLRADDKKNPLGVVGALVYSRNIIHPNCPEIRIPLYTRSNAKAGEVERDAARYRWLRNEAHKEPFYSKLGPYTDWGGELGSIGGLDLDMAVDEAISAHDKTKA